MEVVPMRLPKNSSPTSTVGLPFNRRNVEEWSRVDRLTGIMETAKIETDHWAGRSKNAAHNYGKVIDSRERNNFDGSLKERQRRQMEVFQTKVAGGSMQVIRTQSITTSSKKWSSTSDKGFEDFELPVNSLDLSPQKTKGSVGRSGSIGGRRPPTRPRSLSNQSSNINNAFGEESPSFRLRDHHRQSKMDTFEEYAGFGIRNQSSDEKSDDHSGVVITDVTDVYPASESSAKSGLTRQKSCSNENLADESSNDSLLRRSSKVRRSLQCHKPSFESDSVEEFELGPTKSLKERAAEIERLLRRGNTTSLSQNREKSPESYGKMKFHQAKDSFISAEILKEVRDRLKKPNSSDNESKDDGIGTEKSDFGSPSNDFEQEIRRTETNADIKKPNINGTGSLESRFSNRNSANGSRTAEWYRRRKSYGFEQVDEYGKFDRFNNKKGQIDSSTDSGIWQSSETMAIPSLIKTADSKFDAAAAINSKKDPSSAVVTVRVDNFNHSSSSNHQTSSLSFKKSINSVYLDGHGDSFSTHGDKSKKSDDRNASTFGHDYQEESRSLGENAWTRKSPLPIHKGVENRENCNSSLCSTKNPWISQLRGTKLVNRNWISDEQENPDENRLRKLDNFEKGTGRVTQGKDDQETNGQKKCKKVEFCKTEVHFAAESGKFNIVETDGKPPPSDIFRRRRRNTGLGSSGFSKDSNGLPEIKFGDSILEKTMLTNQEKIGESISDKIEAELKELSRIVRETLPEPKKSETDDFQPKNSSNLWLYDVVEESVSNESGDSSVKPKSILKNYGNSSSTSETESKKSKSPESMENRSRIPTPAPISSTPVWQSTVFLMSKRFDGINRRGSEEERKLYSSDGESELQIRIRNLRKIDADRKNQRENSGSVEKNSDSKRRSLPDEIFLENSMDFPRNSSLTPKVSISSEEMPTLSVAERIKQVEQLKSNNYSTKINFRSGEVTVIQNGNADEFKSKKSPTSWIGQRKFETVEDRPPSKEDCKIPGEKNLISGDELTTSNPSVMRFSTRDDKSDNQKYQTTRILINFKTSAKDETTKQQTEILSPEKINQNNNNLKAKTVKSINNYGSWSSGMKKDLNRYLNDLKSTSLVREMIHPRDGTPEASSKEEIPKPSKSIHEIIDKFDSLSLPKRTFKEKRRKPIPISYRNPVKEYTHSDLEEELKNFTDNLDKDFKDIYEEEIGSFRRSKSFKETRRESGNPPKSDNAVLLLPSNRSGSYFSGRSSSDEGSKKSSMRTSSRDNYDTDDSDLLADEEVRSYMSAGHGGSDSETEGAYGSSGSRKSFEDSILPREKSEKDVQFNSEPRNAYPKSNSSRKYQGGHKDPIDSSKIASISLKYEDDPFFSKEIHQYNLKSNFSKMNGTSNESRLVDAWNGKSSSRTTSNRDGGKPRERISYLNGLSLSEKYSRNLLRSPHSSSEAISDCNAYKPKRISENLYDEPDESFPSSMGGRSEAGNDDYKSRYGHRSHPKGETESEQTKYRREEKVVRERSSQSKSSKKVENLDDSRHRSKSTPEESSGRKNLMEKYRIQDQRGEKSRRRESDRTEAELEELKRAEKSNVMAVNGFTDDSSLVGSSEDERPKRITKKKTKMCSLGTISEGKRVSKTETRKTVPISTKVSTAGNHSSASSVENLARVDSKRPIRESKLSSRSKNVDGSKSSSSRSNRLIKRATSREAIMGHRSSSEDIPSSYLEQAKRRVTRRQKTGSLTKSEVAGTTETQTISSIRHKSKSQGTEGSIPRNARTTRSERSERLERSEKSKESSRYQTRSSKSSQIVVGEKTKSSSRKIVAEKSEIESIRKRRSQRISSREEHASSQARKKRVANAGKTPEVIKASQST